MRILSEKMKSHEESNPWRQYGWELALCWRLRSVEEAALLEKWRDFPIDLFKLILKETSSLVDVIDLCDVSRQTWKLFSFGSENCSLWFRLLEPQFVNEFACFAESGGLFCSQHLKKRELLLKQPKSRAISEQLKKEHHLQLVSSAPAGVVDGVVIFGELFDDHQRRRCSC